MARGGRTVEARLTRAKTILLIGQPFYGTLICNLRLVEDNSLPTMGTDGEHIFWNREFTSGLTDAEIVFVLAHETAHCAHLHHVRRAGRNPTGWNIAADYAINIDLVDARVGVMPKCGLLDKRFKNWSAERIYAELAKQQAKQPQPQPGQGEGNDGEGQGGGQPGGQPGEQPGQGGGGGTKQGDPGQCGQVMDGGATPEQLRKQERVWQQRVRQALNNAVKSGGAGAIPGSMQEVLKRLKSGGEDWRHVLRNFVDPSSRQDYVWSRPDRRFAGMPFILPGTVSCGVNHIVVAVDTSGSIDSDKCAAFLNECQALLDQEFVDKLTVLQCDTAIADCAEYVPGDIVPTKVGGRGGTKFSPVWDWVEACDEDISALVYFTDLEPNGGQFGNEPRVPVLWACQNEDTNRKPPFGDLTVIGS